MMITAEKASQNATTAPRHAVHQTSFLWALVQALVRSTGQRCEAAIGAGLPSGAISPRSPRRVNRSRITPES